MAIIITLTETRMTKNPNTKTTYIVESEDIRECTEKEHYNCTNEQTLKWFRRFGGSETAERSYTCAGYVVTKLTSTIPDKQTKVIRKYKFKYVD